MRGHWLRTLAALAAALLFLLPSPAQTGERVVLTTLEWPPYTGAGLEDQGASTRIARAAFAAAGIDFTAEFFPWKRAVLLARTSPDHAGYFPEYLARETTEDFIYSERMGDSPLVFIENPARPVAWSSLDDLAGLRIGTVAGYVNTAEFDRRAAEGRLVVEPVTDDETNIRKVAAGRLDLAVIDANVFRYLAAHEPDLAPLRDRVRVNARPLDSKGLFLCFRRDAEGERLARAFNAGLARIDYQRMQDEYLARVLP